MKEKFDWKRSLYVIGVLCLIFGAIDPLEGSVVIAAGAIFVPLSVIIRSDSHTRLFIIACSGILFGVFFLWLFTFLGGIGGNSELSGWWGLLLIPYPLGWLMAVILLIARMFKDRD